MPGTNFLPALVPYGQGGLDLHHAVDQLNPVDASRLTNFVRGDGGTLIPRPGLKSLFTVNFDTLHSVIRVSDPLLATTGSVADAYKHIVGADEALCCGQTGLLPEIDNGYSGNPLTFVVERPPLSGVPWVYVADSQRMRKVRVSDCLDLPIGFPPAGVQGDDRFRIDEFARIADGGLDASDRTRFSSVGFDITAASVEGDFAQLGAIQKTTIDTFEVAGWTNNQGTGTAPPSNATTADHKEGTLAVQFTTGGGAAAGYYNFWAKANALNLDLLNTIVAASDDDLLHFWLKVDRPDLVDELRLYFVCSTPFNTATIPGTHATQNTDAYMKAFRPVDWTPLFEASVDTLDAAGSFNTTNLTVERLDKITDSRQLITLLKQQREAFRATPFELGPGRSQWTEFGIIGLPLRRGDFRRIGTDATRAWANVTGLIILAKINAADVVNIIFDDMYLHGGYGPDTSPIGSTSYDWRAINYDPRTGDKGNPSGIMKANLWLDPARRKVLLTPSAYGDAAVRQRFYRRGGTLVTNWYFLGENGADGGVFEDTLSDAAIVNAGTLEIDNDQPVTTVDEAGDTVLAQPIPAIFGPVLDLMLGCGDPYRPGHLYWSKPGIFSSWPFDFNTEVCPPSEELMAGCVLNGQGFVYSRERGFSCYINQNVVGQVVALANGCRHGLASRKALAVGIDGMYFVATDGIYHTAGGPEQSITDQTIAPLFDAAEYPNGKNGYLPIDFASPDEIQAFIHQNDLWVIYMDTAGTRQAMIYNILQRYWRHYRFTPTVVSGFSATIIGDAPTLILGTAGRSPGAGFTHTGPLDDTDPISGVWRSGAMDQLLPRQDKLYGDIFLEAEAGGLTLTLTPFLNSESITLDAQTMTTSARDRKYFDLLLAAAEGPRLGRNISLQVAFTQSAAPARPPMLFLAGLSWIPQPDDTVARVTDLSSEGRLVDKWFKGVLMEVDTENSAKQVRVEVDGVVAATLTATANGRSVLQFSFAAARGRLARLRPIGSGEWKLYDFRWIFDEEPAALTRWETQELDHGQLDYHSLLFGEITLRSTATVTLQITSRLSDGSNIVKTYAIPTTAGAKRKVFVPFEATQGVLHQYLFTCASAFWLYREESSITVQPWGGNPQPVHPFGNDDLDLVRNNVDAGLAASRPGGPGGGGTTT